MTTFALGAFWIGGAYRIWEDCRSGGMNRLSAAFVAAVWPTLAGYAVANRVAHAFDTPNPAPEE